MVIAAYLGLFHKILPISQISPVKRTGRDTESGCNRQTKQYDAFRTMKLKKRCSDNEHGLKTGSYTSLGYEYNYMGKKSCFDRKA